MDGLGVLGGPHREAAVVWRANVTRPGSRIGFLKLTSTVYASGSGSSAARHRAFVHIPCAIACGKPNSSRAQRVQMDRIAVAGDRAVPPPQIAGQPPLHRSTREFLRLYDVRFAASPAPLRPPRRLPGVGAATAATEHDALVLPHELAVDPRLGDERERPALRMRLDRGRPHDRSKTSDTRAGRCTTIRLERCTSPTAGNGNLPSVINCMCSGNALTCRYVAGSASRSVKPQTRA